MNPSETPSDPAPQKDLAAWLVLVVIGVAWGITGPLTKLAVSTGNHPIGITLWDNLLSAIGLTTVLIVLRRPLPLSRNHIVFYLICSLLGTVIPNVLSYSALRHLSVGVYVIIISLVPITTLIISLPLGIERADPRRFLGLICGVIAILMIALPDASLPEPGLAGWAALTMLTAIAYSAENVYIAGQRPQDLDPIRIICGLNWAAIIVVAPITAFTGGWVDLFRFSPPEQAIIANSALHVGAYMGFVWLIGRAGPVFAAQVAYVVTGTGVLLGILVYGETHSIWIWGALALIVFSLSLVTPRKQPLPGLPPQMLEADDQP